MKLNCLEISQNIWSDNVRLVNVEQSFRPKPAWNHVSRKKFLSLDLVDFRFYVASDNKCLEAKKRI